MGTRTFLIRAEISRDYGKHKVTFGLSESVECASSGAVKDAFLDLQSLLENQIQIYEQVSLPHVKLPNAVGAVEGYQHSGDSFPLELIKVEFTEGKKRIKAVGGKYTKHGVPVYKECATDLDVEKLDFGVHDFRHLNMTVKVELDGNKPRRALSIR